MATCNRDCFNCLKPDCTVNTMSKKERRDVKKRDANYFNTGSVMIIHSSGKAKNRYSR